MKRFFLYTIILLFMSCGKNHMDEFATGNNQKGIVGKWKLVRSESGIGNGDVNVVDRRSENVIITFDSIGNTTDPRFECKGKYNFTWDEEGKNHGPNMTINLIVLFQGLILYLEQQNIMLDLRIIIIYT